MGTVFVAVAVVAASVQWRPSPFAGRCCARLQHVQAHGSVSSLCDAGRTHWRWSCLASNPDEQGMSQHRDGFLRFGNVGRGIVLDDGHSVGLERHVEMVAP